MFGLQGKGAYLSNLACLVGAGNSQTFTGGSTSTLSEDLVGDIIIVDDWTLKTGGYAIYCNKLILRNGGLIENNGLAGTTGAGSAAGGLGAVGFTCGAGLDGGDGQTGTGDNGTGDTQSAIADAPGGDGGNTGGVGGDGNFDSTMGTTFQHSIRDMGLVWDTGTLAYRVLGGSGGGGGTGDGGSIKGGGGGGGGGVIRIYANEIFIGTSCHIQSNGGAGGLGGVAAGGGGGGGGGAILLVCGQIHLLDGATSKITVAGGNGGTGHSGALNGVAGTIGYIYLWSELGIMRETDIDGTSFPELPVP